MSPLLPWLGLLGLWGALLGMEIGFIAGGAEYPLLHFVLAGFDGSGLIYAGVMVGVTAVRR